jgi:hypothetical protein
MPFKRPVEDHETFRELITNRVISHETWEMMRKEETHALMDVVLDNEHLVDNDAWREWLVRRHGLPAFQELPAEPETIPYNKIPPELCVDFLETKAYPLLLAHNVLYLAVGRPQLRRSWLRAKEALACEGVMGLACGPSKLLEFHSDFKTRVAPALKKINYRA